MKFLHAVLPRLALVCGLLAPLAPAHAAIEVYQFSLVTSSGVVGSGNVTFSDLAADGAYYYQNGFADQSSAYIMSGTASLTVPGYPLYTRTYNFLPRLFGLYNNMNITADIVNGVVAGMSFIGHTFDQYSGLGQDIAQLSIGPDNSFTFENRGSYNGMSWDFATVGTVVFERVAAPVPEPEIVLMMLAGLGGVGWRLRRQRQPASA